MKWTLKDGQEADEVLSLALLAYVIFFLLSIYLTGFFESEINQAYNEAQFTDKHFQRLFEFSMESKSRQGAKNALRGMGRLVRQKDDPVSLIRRSGSVAKDPEL